MLRKLATSLLVALALVFLANCRHQPSKPAPADGKIRVAATIFPLADVIRNIGGQDVEVFCLLGPGQSEHDFQPTAQHAESLAGAKLVVLVGLGSDEWAMPAIRATASGARLLRLGEGVEPLAAQEEVEGHEAHDEGDDHESPDANHGHGHDHGNLTGDPHVWLDPVLMQTFVTRIAEEFSQIDPPHAGQYAQRRDAYLAELRKLDEEYRTALGGLKHREFVTFHAAFNYIAQRYGLRQLSLHNVDAAGFDPQHLEDVMQFVKEHQIKAIFAEPQYPSEKLQMLADAAGVSVGKLDPLGEPGMSGYDSYLAMMRSNLKSLAAALKD